jgi:hypothetical protein
VNGGSTFPKLDAGIQEQTVTQLGKTTAVPLMLAAGQLPCTGYRNYFTRFWFDYLRIPFKPKAKISLNIFRTVGFTIIE